MSKRERDPHKFPMPIWATVQRIFAVYGIGALIILPWKTERIEDWVLMFITALFAMFLVDVVFHRIVVRPIRIEWAIEHAKEYHPEDYEAMKDRFDR